MNLAPTLTALFGWPLLILSLAIYSLTRLITKDSLIDRQRDWFFDRFGHEGYTTKRRPTRGKFIVTGDHYYVTVGTYLGELVHCPWCMGFWVSLGLCLAFWAAPVAVTFALVPLALRVIPGVIEAVID